MNPIRQESSNLKSEVDANQPVIMQQNNYQLCETEIKSEVNASAPHIDSEGRKNDRFRPNKPMQQRNYQWCETENALAKWSEFITLKCEKPEEINNFFLEGSCLAMEKYDGTNVGISSGGQLYARRTFIPDDQESFIKTSLDPIRDRSTSVKVFKDRIETETGLQSIISEVVVYGELIVNDHYKYTENGWFGNWKVFGAVIETSSVNTTLNKLIDCGYSARQSKKVENQVQILLNRNFAKTMTELGFDCSESALIEGSIYDLVISQQEKLRKIEMEGLVITYRDKLVKWKSANEPQHNSEIRVKEAFELISEIDVDPKVKELFHILIEVLEDKSFTPIESEIHKLGKQKNYMTKKKKFTMQSKKNIKTNEMDTAIREAQTKFDDINEIVRKGETFVEDYIDNIVKEVLQDKDVTVDNLEDMEKFIRGKLKGVCKTIIANKNKTNVS